MLPINTRTRTRPRTKNAPSKWPTPPSTVQSSTPTLHPSRRRSYRNPCRNRPPAKSWSVCKCIHRETRGNSTVAEQSLSLPPFRMYSGVCHTDYGICTNGFSTLPATSKGKVLDNGQLPSVIALIARFLKGKSEGTKVSAYWSAIIRSPPTTNPTRLNRHWRSYRLRYRS